MTHEAAGRVFRLAAGTGFLAVGLLFRDDAPGLAAMIWSVFPMTAGAFDVCSISVALGGPFAGAKIRELQAREVRRLLAPAGRV